MDAAAASASSRAVMLRDILATLDRQQLGRELHATARQLYPICRSLTGDGVRETLALLGGIVPLDIHEVASGTPAFDWQVPAEWNIRDAWIKDRHGTRIVDFRQHNLHVVGYSRPVHRWMTRQELLPYLHSVPAMPDVVPYRTSYYADTWGFCVPHRLLESLADDDYEVCIDATLEDGALTYGEFVVAGHLPDEVLLSCHVCHPSLADDNLSGMVIAAFLARQLTQLRPRYSYRFLFIPGTIGSLTWLSRNPAAIGRIRAGLVLTCLGDDGPFTYKRSRRGDTVIDRLAVHQIAHSGHPSQIRDFSPYGYDERQFCAPGFNLPVGRLSRSAHGEFPEYHTSADNLDFVTPEALAGSYTLLLRIVDAWESNRTYLTLSPMGEPQLGRRGLYGAIGGTTRAAMEMALLWVLNQSDGRHSLIDIAERAGQPFEEIRDAAHLLEQHGLLRPCDEV
jgi:aminopeptidase-like protein